MFSAQTVKLRKQVEATVSVAAKHEQFRSVLSQPPAANDPPQLTLFRADAPDLLQWRIYDHSACYTRLYALLESHICGLVDEWLALLPTLCKNYNDLPDVVKATHRTGVGQILLKLGGDQYKHLSEGLVLKGIAAGVSGAPPYSLLSDAFYSETANFWSGTLDGLFSRIGLPSPWSWVNRHRALVIFLRDFRGNASTPQSELDSLVRYRNEAAHGEVRQIVAIEEFKIVAKFVIALCESLAQFVMWHVISRRHGNGEIEAVGTVITNFADNIVGVECSGLDLSVGQSVIVMRDHACYFTTIKTLEENHVSYTAIAAKPGQRVAMDLADWCKLGSKLVRVRPIESHGHGEDI